jgi:hypothetical protein
MRISVALLLMLLGAGCPTQGASRLDPRASYPDARTGNVVRPESENGCLTVMSPRIRVDQDGRLFELPHDLDWASSHLVPSGYSVFDRQGRHLLDVPNHSPLVVSDEDPTPVELPPGRYLVRLDQALPGVGAFWVTIEPRGRTEVDPARLGRVREPRVEEPQVR